MKRYVAEAGSTWLRAILDPGSGCTVVIARTTAVEVVAAFARQARGDTLQPAHAAIARKEFLSDLAAEYQVLELSAALAEEAMLLAERHALRGYDAIQLAAALKANALRLPRGLPAMIVVSSDTELNAAATAEGLRVEDPNAQ